MASHEYTCPAARVTITLYIPHIETPHYYSCYSERGGLINQRRSRNLNVNIYAKAINYDYYVLITSFLKFSINVEKTKKALV